MFTLNKKRKNIIGIDIGNSTINMVEVAIGEKPTILKWGSKNNPMANSPLSEISKKEIVPVIKKCLKDMKTKTRLASICLSDPSLIVKEITLPFMGEAELLENIRFELSEYFQDDFKEYNFSYKFINSLESGKEMINVLVAAMPMPILLKVKDIITSSNMDLKYIDVSANAVSKVLPLLNIKESGEEMTLNLKPAVCVVDVNTRNVETSIYANGKYIVSKSGSMFSSDDFESILSNANEVIDYFSRRNHEFIVTNLLLIGEGANQEDLAEHIYSQTGIFVQRARYDMFGKQMITPDNFPAATYFKALGATIRED